MQSATLFISYAGADERIARKISGYLEAKGISCWYAARDIQPSAIYADAIVTALQGCSACLVIVSEAANSSSGVKRELELAHSFGKPYIPIRIGGAIPQQGLGYYLQNAQHVEYGTDGEAALTRIVTLLEDARHVSSSEITSAMQLGWIVKVDWPMGNVVATAAKKWPALAFVAIPILGPVLLGATITGFMISKTHAIRTDDGEVLGVDGQEVDEAKRGKPLPVRVTFRREGDRALDVKAV